MGTIGTDVSGRAGASIATVGRRRLVGLAAVGAAVCAFVLVGAATSFAAAPVTTAQVTPSPSASGWYLTNAAVTITLNAADTGTGVSSIRYRWLIDSAAPGEWTTVSGNQAVATNNSASQAGIHRLEYYAVDNGNVEEDGKTVEIKRDSAAPMLRLASNPLVPSGIGGAWLPGVQFLTIAVDPPPTGSVAPVTTSEVDEDSVQHRLAGSGTWLPGDAPITLNSVGTYTIEGRASDNAGNSVTENLPPIVVEQVSSGLRVGMKSSGSKKTKQRNKVIYKVQATNNYVSPMNLQTKVCASVNKSSWAEIQYLVPTFDENGVQNGTKWTKGKCDTNFSLAAGAVFKPQFRVAPTKKAAKRAKKGQKTNIKVTFKTSVPAYGTRTQAITLKVQK